MASLFIVGKITLGNTTSFLGDTDDDDDDDDSGGGVLTKIKEELPNFTIILFNILQR